MTWLRNIVKVWLGIILFLPLVANAAYERNVAKPVNEVVYGKIDAVRYITQQEDHYYFLKRTSNHSRLGGFYTCLLII